MLTHASTTSADAGKSHGAGRGTPVAPEARGMAGALTEAIQRTVESVWATLLGLEVQRRVVPLEDEASRGWAGAVSISGAWQGEVQVHCSIELAHRAAAILFAIDRATANTEQAEDALRELANVTGGNLMEVLPGPSKLSMPSVWSCAEGRGADGGGLLLSRLYFECQGEPLSVVVRRAPAS
jgi:chemotaxis protein CheX